ncbi:MAG: S9 family peptidase [Prevotella pallens]|nr:prolyl oligopeptidase family serine peptidase [Prevotella pallens]MBF1525415.1 S9 family peptidase [Prevotella pallens]
MKHFVALSVLALTTTTMVAQNINYPKALKDGTVDTYFGVKIPDPFRPLEADRSKETAEWVAAENKVTNEYLAKIPFRAKLLQRLKEVADYEKVGAPFENNGKWYVFKNNGLQNQSVLYQMNELGGTLHEFLDPNKLSTDGTVALQDISFSKDGKHMAYVISRSGSDWQEIYVKDVATGKLLSDHIEWAKFGGAKWCGNGFYYSAYDAPEKGKEYSSKNEIHKIYYHKIGTPQSQDVLFYQNPTQPLRFYSVSLNKEETIMFLYESGAGSGMNLYVRDLRVPNSQFIQMTSNMDLQYNPIGTVGDNIYLLTNDGAPKGRIMVANVHKPGFKDWKELVGETKNVLENAQFAADKLVLSYSKDASTHLYVYSLDGKELNEIKLPTVGRASFSGERGQKECFYSFASFTVPGAIYQYDMAQNKSSVYTEPKVKFSLNQYTTEQVFFNSKDGTRVPMFLTYRKGLKRNGKNPVLIYGYGGFNISLSPNFSSMRIPFLENGGVYVQVNLRGGSEYGEEWHVAGTKMQKQNVFDDFISAAEWLVSNHFTSKEHIAIMGGSNGGLLVGACMTQRPDLFKVCIPQVGVMDMLRYHKFTIGWNWAPDYGTSEDSKAMFDYLRAYSPLHNLKKGVNYPATLVTTADHDDRVVPAHSFKFAATLQECQGGTAPVLIRIDSKAGHGSGKPLAKQLEEQADIYSFIMWNLGMKFK